MTDSKEIQSTADDLVPVLYDELRRLARARMANLAPGNTLQPTALVHEVFVKLSRGGRTWNGRGHFFGAAAQAMRQILIDQARRKKTPMHGGDQKRVDVDDIDIAVEVPAEKLLALDEALTRLQKDDARKAEIVMLRYFAGLEREEIAEMLGVSLRTVDRDWRFAAARLQRDMNGSEETG